MKKQILMIAAIVISVSAYSQTKENIHKEHGTEVNTVARTESEARLHGKAVSTVASSNEGITDGPGSAGSGRRHEGGKGKMSGRTGSNTGEACSPRERLSGTGMQRGTGIGVNARSGVQGKISRPNIRSNVRVNAGVRIF